jgi:stearoyl-CoA desaturase (delta-9 desaturase)
MQNVLEFEKPRTGINWKNVAIITSFHLLAIPAFFTFSWQNLAALLIGNWIVGSLGVGLGWHRLLTHRGLNSSWLEYALSIFVSPGFA